MTYMGNLYLKDLEKKGYKFITLLDNKEECSNWNVGDITKDLFLKGNLRNIKRQIEFKELIE